ncbi:MAG: hypothetical protein ABFC97_06415 [Anaerolineaceae bacterium]
MSGNSIKLTFHNREISFSMAGEESPEVEMVIRQAVFRFYDRFSALFASSGRDGSYLVLLNQQGGNNFQKGNQIHLNPRNLTEWTVTHELAHTLDAAYHWQLSRQMKAFTHSRFPFKALHQVFPAWQFLWYRAGSPPPPCGIDRHFNSLEDFAESITAYLFPEEAHQRAASRGYPYEKWGYTYFHDTPRGEFIAELLNQPAGALL